MISFRSKLSSAEGEEKDEPITREDEEEFLDSRMDILVLREILERLRDLCVFVGG